MIVENLQLTGSDADYYTLESDSVEVESDAEITNAHWFFLEVCLTEDTARETRMRASTSILGILQLWIMTTG